VPTTQIEKLAPASPSSQTPSFDAPTQSLLHHIGGGAGGVGGGIEGGWGGEGGGGGEGGTEGGGGE
jgi:hypothetical protein